MELALYGRGGFYERPPVGRAGHYVTSPHVHPVFVDFLRAALMELWPALGRPDPLPLFELGAGDGTLARLLLEGFGPDGPLVEYVAVEPSAGARASLAEAGLPVLERIDDVGAIEGGVVFANELLDNLPFDRVRAAGVGLVEVRVGQEGDGFGEVEVPCAPDLAALAPALKPGEEATAATGALRLVDALGARLRRGYALLIDYGSAGGPAGEVHGYRAHRVVEDVFADPGSADITAGVDFSAVARRAEDAGLASLGLVHQWRALLALGYERWNLEERSRQTDLLDRGRGMEAVRAWGGRSRASLLVDPAGLGRLRWLLLGTSGLAPPPWMKRTARARPSVD
jgi:NADH dehydrogenase [ubiquinone] 1 alpha subcomplex assembly factor 7